MVTNISSFSLEYESLDKDTSILPILHCPDNEYNNCTTPLVFEKTGKNSNWQKVMAGHIKH